MNQARDDQVAGVADGEVVGPGDRAGRRRRLLGESEQSLGLRQEGPAGRGELTALAGAVEQAHPEALLETLDLPAQGRRGEYRLDWQPAGPTLIEDIDAGHYLPAGDPAGRQPG